VVLLIVAEVCSNTVPVRAPVPSLRAGGDVLVVASGRAGRPCQGPSAAVVLSVACPGGPRVVLAGGVLSPGAACGAGSRRSPWPGRDGGSPCTCRRSSWRSA